jgi:hypothetical protein
MAKATVTGSRVPRSATKKLIFQDPVLFLFPGYYIFSSLKVSFGRCAREAFDPQNFSDKLRMVILLPAHDSHRTTSIPSMLIIRFPTL